jgi:ATP-dependent protease HslVU (ClpYQ) peptidase subunit
VVLPERMTKVIMGSKGHLAGIAGQVDMQCDQFMSWVRGGCVDDPVYPKNDSYFILITPSGILQELGKGESIQRIKHWGYYAWGTGRNFAIGAMAQGATAQEAVEIAIKFDPFSGGKINSYTLAKFQ